MDDQKIRSFKTQEIEAWLKDPSFIWHQLEAGHWNLSTEVINEETQKKEPILYLFPASQTSWEKVHQLSQMREISAKEQVDLEHAMVDHEVWQWPSVLQKFKEAKHYQKGDQWEKRFMPLWATAWFSKNPEDLQPLLKELTPENREQLARALLNQYASPYASGALYGIHSALHETAHLKWFDELPDTIRLIQKHAPSVKTSGQAWGAIVALSLDAHVNWLKPLDWVVSGVEELLTGTVNPVPKQQEEAILAFFEQAKECDCLKEGIGRRCMDALRVPLEALLISAAVSSEGLAKKATKLKL